MINRFIINLRRAGLQSRELESSSLAGHVSTSSDMRFRLPTIPDVIGDMGQPLEHGAMADDSDESWGIGTELREAFAIDIEHRGRIVMA